MMDGAGIGKGVHDGKMRNDLGSGERSMTDFGQLMGGWRMHLAAKLRLDKENYRLIDSVVLPTGDETTARIDHVIVSPYGVFMVETRSMKGLGGKEQTNGIQQFQKSIHPRILAAILGIDASKVLPVLVAAGGGSLQKPVPENVMKAGGLVRYIKSNTIRIITKTEVAKIVQKLESGQLMLSDKARAALAGQTQGAAKAPPAAKPCPRCGSPMVLRKAKQGAQAGKKYWVCSTFPRCKAAIEYRVPAKPDPVPDFGPPNFQ
jgi:restriction system protein